MTTGRQGHSYVPTETHTETQTETAAPPHAEGPDPHWDPAL
jgi:hypothetical protein